MESQCDVYKRLFDGYCSATLTDEERSSYDEHLRNCGYCQEQYSAYGKTVTLINAVKPPAIDESFWVRQQASISALMASRRLSEAWQAPPFSLVIMLVMVGVYIIDGLGCMYISSSYFGNVMSFISKTAFGQYFDTSIVLYFVMAVIGMISFFSEPEPEKVNVSRRVR